MENSALNLELNPKLTAALTKKQRKQINSLLLEPPRKYALNMRLASHKLEKMLDFSIQECIRYIKNYQNIVCFSETQTSPTMWAYYSDSHKGFVVEYDFKNYNTPCVNCSHKCDINTTNYYFLLFIRMKDLMRKILLLHLGHNKC